MGLIYNPLNKANQVKALGNYFDFKPGQIKPLNDEVARFIASNKKESGLVEVMDILIDEPDSAEAKAHKEEKRIEGLTNVLKFYKAIVQNLVISLRKDLDHTNDKADLSAYLSDGEKNAMKIVKEITAELNVVTANKDEESKELIKEMKEALTVSSKEFNIGE